MQVDVPRANFHAGALRPVLVKLPAEDCSGKDVGKIGVLKKSMYGTRDAASNWARDWHGHVESLVNELERSSRNLFHNKKQENFRFDTRRRFCGDRNEGVCWSWRSRWRAYPNQSEHPRGKSGKEYQGAESENTLG